MDKSGDYHKKETRFLVITVSDSCYNGKAEDKSGPCLTRLIEECFPQSVIEGKLVPDSQDTIEKTLRLYIDGNKTQAIFTTGGTGFSPRDVTPEATRSVIDRECPQLALAMSLESFKKTPFAALSRAVCGIAKSTLIINFPGSVKAVMECFDAIKHVLPHAIQLIGDDMISVTKTHKDVQQVQRHICPHKTGTGIAGDRNSPFPMLPVSEALNIILNKVDPLTNLRKEVQNLLSPVNIPPFRASVKDGYALRSSGLSGVKKVVDYIAAGDTINEYELKDDECFKINTGAPLPKFADCVIQIEDTRLHKSKADGREELVEIFVEPQALLDVRPIGCDLLMGSNVFPTVDFSNVILRSLYASIGRICTIKGGKIGIISTGSELVAPTNEFVANKIYDSNTTMLEELLKYFGFECSSKQVVADDFETTKKAISKTLSNVDFLICSGGVSMGDKDYIKPILKDLGFTIHFGRVNMKPGKPMTFASKDNKYFFGLPGNPVSAFVTFHLFVLPALRYQMGWERSKCELAKIKVKLGNESISLDSRPEYVRASITSRNGELIANVNGDQMSSRLQSIVGADALLHLPGSKFEGDATKSGDVLDASVLRFDFISKYE